MISMLLALCEGNPCVTSHKRSVMHTPLMFSFMLALTSCQTNIWIAGDLRCCSAHIDHLVQDCSISSALAMEILQSCTKSSNDLTVIIFFQVICYNLLCHPTWVKDYHNESVNHQTTNSIKDFKKDMFAIHFTMPNPKEFLSEQDLRENSHTFFGKIGQYILEKAGLW